MYQSFPGISDSLWIYWAHSLVCDCRKKRCENHLHSLKRGTFDNEQRFSYTQQGGKMPKPGNALWAQWGTWSIFLQSCVCVRDRLCVVNKCLPKSLMSQPQSHVQLPVVLRISGNSLKRFLWTPTAVTKESHCWQCPANASCWQTFLLSAKGELFSFCLGKFLGPSLR